VLANRGCHRFGSYWKNSRFFAIFFIGLLFGEYIPRTVEIAEGSFRLGVLRSSLLHRLEGGAEKPWVWNLENSYVIFDIQTCSVFRSHGSNSLVFPGTLDAHFRKPHIRNRAEQNRRNMKMCCHASAFGRLNFAVSRLWLLVRHSENVAEMNDWTSWSSLALVRTVQNEWLSMHWNESEKHSSRR